MAEPGSAGTGAAEYAARLQRRHESPPTVRAASALVQRVASVSSSSPDSSSSSDPADLRDDLVRRDGGGAAPDSSLRDRMGSHLPFDTGAARLHQGPAAAAAARSLNADAFTIGRDVFFGEGQFSPHSRAGVGLIAHELTHVGQQTQGVAPSMPLVARQPEDDGYAPLERPENGPDENGNTPQPGGVLHQSEAAQRPSLDFALPPPEPEGETPPEPSGTATEERGGTTAGSRPAAPAQKADARAVADRVYELMKQEILLGQRRGGFRGR